jgi:hypothetical protein
MTLDFDFDPGATPSPQNISTTADSERKYEDELYKRWYKSGGKSGFISITPWWGGGKLAIDIGEALDSGVKNTKVWTNVIDIAVYLRAVYDGKATSLYPANERMGAPTSESFVYYGGGEQDGKPVSRVMKIHHWGSKEKGYDSSAFVWKAGHFAARKSQTGAFIPDMSNPLSVNLIKITRKEMAEISYRIDLALTLNPINNG